LSGSAAETQIQPPFGKMVQKRHPAGDMCRVMLVQTDRSWPHPDLGGLAQRTGNEDFGHHDGAQMRFNKRKYASGDSGRNRQNISEIVYVLDKTGRSPHQ
jgi:hypothetical protein